jgi:hypothetical protein
MPRPGAPSLEPAEHDGALTLTIENDTFTGSDNNYTNGVGLGWSTDEVGWKLVDAFGLSPLRSGFDTSTTNGVGPVEDWSFSFFGSVGGCGIVHYLPLDGTVFKDSRSVASEPFVGMTSAGLTLRCGWFVPGLGMTYTTDAFEAQTENDEYGTVSLSWFF